MEASCNQTLGTVLLLDEMVIRVVQVSSLVTSLEAHDTRHLKSFP